MAKYFLRPMEVDAVMFDGKTVGDRAADGILIEDTAPAWFTPHETSRIAQDITVQMPIGNIMQTSDGLLIVGTHRGTITVVPGDWLVMYPDGNLVVEKADVFAVTYALPLEVVKELEDAYHTDAVQPKSWLGRLFERASILVRKDQEKLF
jgi:hypothetical protein